MGCGRWQGSLLQSRAREEQRTLGCGQTCRFRCERTAFGERESGQAARTEAQTDVAVPALCTQCTLCTWAQTGRDTLTGEESVLMRKH